MKLDNNNLILNIYEQYLFSVLTNKENQTMIQNALDWQNFKGKLIINRIKNIKELQEEDIEKLKSYCSDIKIIEGDKNGI